MTTWRFELLGALRSLWRRRVLTMAAATTLALGVGINGAMFSIVESLLLSPLPFPADSPDRVVVIAERNPPRDNSEPGRMSVSYPTFRDWLTMARSFETIAGFRNTSVTWQRAGGAERVQQRQTSASYFELMGIQPLIGRPFTAREDGPGAGRVVLLGEGLWHESFGGSADVLGETMRLDGEVHEIIGVLPAEVAPGEDTMVYVPLEPWALSNE